MLSFISDLRRRRPLSTYPPGRTSSPQAPVYLVFQPIRFTLSVITEHWRELLPRDFTLTGLRRRYLFCGTVCHARARLPVRKYGALRCPDFPQPRGRDNSVFLFAIYDLRFTVIANRKPQIVNRKSILIIQHHRHDQHQHVLVLVMLGGRSDESGARGF